MNGIGVTQWQDNETEFPLRNAGDLAGLFCDASLVVYDNFVPILNQVIVSDSNITITITFDNGSHDFTCTSNLAMTGSLFRLRTNDRTYGVIVWGRIIADVLAGIYGGTITSEAVFESICVRSINSNSGLFSVNGISTDPNITLDANMWFANPVCNAVSVPSNLTFVTTSSNNFYVNTTQLNLIELNPTTSANSNILIVDKTYTGLANSGTRFIAAYGDSTTSNLCELNSTPSTHIVYNIPHPINCLMFNGASLYALSGSNLLVFGNYPYTASPIVSTLDFSPRSAIVLNNVFIACIDGDTDYSNSTQFSTKFYSITLSGIPFTSTLLGTMTDGAGNNHMPNLISMTVHNNLIYGVAYHTGTGFILYKIDPVSFVATVLTTYLTDTATGTGLSLFVGGNNITTNAISPLKTLNSVSADANNNIAIAGSATLSVTLEKNNTIVFSLPVNDQNLNVTRSTHYE